jgi:prevent-host-death family protein
MPFTTLSSREFNQDTSRAKKAAAEGPVFITDRGRPAHVLISIAEYRRLRAGGGASSTLYPCRDLATSNSSRRGRVSCRGRPIFLNVPA